MQQWPSLLPGIALDFSVDTDGSGLRATSPYAPAQAARFQTDRQQQSVKWVMSEAQYALFLAFWKHKLHLGADDFVLDLPFGNNLEEAVVRIVDGRFRASFVDPHWSISATIEIDNPPTAAS